MAVCSPGRTLAGPARTAADSIQDLVPIYHLLPIELDLNCKGRWQATAGQGEEGITRRARPRDQ